MPENYKFLKDNLYFHRCPVIEMNEEIEILKEMELAKRLNIDFFDKTVGKSDNVLIEIASIYEEEKEGKT